MDQRFVGEGMNLHVKAKSLTITDWMTHEEMKL